MNNVVPFDFNGLQVRTATDENAEPLFMAKDVCEVLGISKYRDAVSKLSEDERVSAKMDTLGGKQSAIFVTESGLYHLIFRSNKPEAEVFRLWVTKEVLPSIRKTGSYTLADPTQMANMIEEVFVRVSRGVSLTPHKRKPGTKLNDEEKDTLDRLANDYWAYAEMAREIGCDPKTVSRYLKQKHKEREVLEAEVEEPSLFDVKEEF